MTEVATYQAGRAFCAWKLAGALLLHKWQDPVDQRWHCASPDTCPCTTSSCDWTTSSSLHHYNPHTSTARLDISLLRSPHITTKYKSWLTPTDHMTHCITPSRQRAVPEPGRWVWSTGDGRCSTVNNTSDDWRAVTKLFSVQRLETISRGSYVYVWRYSNFLFVW